MAWPIVWIPGKKCHRTESGKCGESCCSLTMVENGQWCLANHRSVRGWYVTNVKKTKSTVYSLGHTKVLFKKNALLQEAPTWILRYWMKKTVMITGSINEPTSLNPCDSKVCHSALSYWQDHLEFVELSLAVCSQTSPGGQRWVRLKTLRLIHQCWLPCLTITGNEPCQPSLIKINHD